MLFQVSELLNSVWPVSKLDFTVFQSLLPKDAHFCLKHSKLVHTLLYINFFVITYDKCQFHLKCNNFIGIVTIKCEFHVRCNNFVGIVIFCRDWCYFEMLALVEVLVSNELRVPI